MNTIKTKINFLHDARPYIAADEYQNIVVEYPLGAIPEKGDILIIDGITHPKGTFFVNYWMFESKDGYLHEVILTLGVEGLHSM